MWFFEREEGAVGYPRRPQSTETRNGWTEFGRSEVLVLGIYCITDHNLVWEEKTQRLHWWSFVCDSHECASDCKSKEQLSHPNHNQNCERHVLPKLAGTPAEKAAAAASVLPLPSVASSIHSPSFIIACLLSLLNSPSSLTGLGCHGINTCSIRNSKCAIRSE